MSKTKLLVLFLVAATFFASISSPAQSRDNEFLERPFIKIFTDKQRKDNEGLGNVSVQAQAYLEACCKTKEDIIEVLKSNGFKVFVKNYREGEIVDRGFDEEYFDTVITGHRISKFTLSHHWMSYIPAEYSISIYRNDEKTERVFARITRTMP